MKAIVVDFNILFSALLKSESSIRDLLGQEKYRFYAPNFLISELFKHRNKVLKGSLLSDGEAVELLQRLLAHIHFVNEEIISTENFMFAFRLCADVDENDTIFLALALELDCDIWTADKKLKSGLTKKGYNRFFEP